MPTQPNLLKIIYCGIIITWNGSIMVTSMQINQKLRPLNFSLANPNAINAEEKTAPMVPTAAIKKEFALLNISLFSFKELITIHSSGYIIVSPPKITRIVVITCPALTFSCVLTELLCFMRITLPSIHYKPTWLTTERSELSGYQLPRA